MKRIELKPIKEEPSDFDKLEELIMKIFREEIYLPLMVEFGLKPKTIQNSLDDLLNAIKSGRIYFINGKFKGRFNSTLSRELRKIGAEWDRKQGSFSIPQSKLTTDVKMAISLSEAQFQWKIAKIMKKLETFSPKVISEKLQATSIFDSVLFKTEKKFEKSIKNISIAPEVTPEQRLRISEEYTNNLQLYIRNFTEKETVELRNNIAETAYSGNRYESVIGKIQQSYGVSQRKARFLARQETSLLMTKYKQTRYESAGINEYKWQCVNNPKDTRPGEHVPGNVRYYHAKNNGKIFRWSEGAIINAKGEKKNPGQDYNCRCVAIPVVSFA